MKRKNFFPCEESLIADKQKPCEVSQIPQNLKKMKTKIIRFSKWFYLLIIPLWIYLIVISGLYEDNSFSGFIYTLLFGLFSYLVVLLIRYGLTIEITEE